MKAQLDTRLEAYQRQGQTAEAGAAIIDVLNRLESRFAGSADFERTAAHYLELLGEPGASDEAFAKIPDASLIGASELVRRLDARYRENPASALPLVDRLLSDESPSGLDAFAQWLHRRLAAQIVPKPVSVEAAAAASSFIKQLKGRAASAASAMAMWLEALSAETDADYARLLRYQNADPLTYATRYQYLLYDLVEAKGQDPAVVEQAGRLRIELVNSLKRPANEGPYGTGRERERLRYWLGYGSARVPVTSIPPRYSLATRGLDAASASPPDASVPPDSIWEEEATLLGGRRQFYWVVAERAKYVDSEQNFRFRAAYWDRSELEELQRLVSRTMPASDFAVVWKHERFKFAPDLPFEVVSKLGIRTEPDVRDRWRVLKVWEPACVACASSVASATALTHDYPGTVAVMTTAGSEEAAGAFVKVRALDVPIAVLSSEALRGLRVLDRRPATILVTPERRFIVLRESDWETEARYWLTLVREQERGG